jgi:polyhydroxybutyrate depolymerase
MFLAHVFAASLLENSCMRKRVLLLTLLVSASAGSRAYAQSSLRAGDHRFSIRHQGRSRAYIAHVPQGSGPFPVLVAYHGGGGEAQGFKDYAGLDTIADRERFVVVYPNGTGVVPNRLLTFNGGACCGYAERNNVDDVGFTMAVLDDLAKRARIDRKRIYATGHSNGAIMAYRLASERADQVAAIVPVAGAMNVPSFAPSRPVPVMHIHSVDDPRALYDGGLGPPFPGTNNRETHEPVQKALDRWIALAGCRTTPIVKEERRGRAGTPDATHRATKLVWPDCRDGVEVVLWKMTGAGHGWPGSARPAVLQELVGPPTTVVNAAEEIWKFVSRFRLP